MAIVLNYTLTAAEETALLAETQRANVDWKVPPEKFIPAAPFTALEYLTLRVKDLLASYAAQQAHSDEIAVTEAFRIADDATKAKYKALAPKK